MGSGTSCNTLMRCERAPLFVYVRAEDGGLAHVPGWGARASFS